MPTPANNPFALPPRLARLQIEITTGCNLRCAGCQRTLGMQAGTWHNGHMPEARFRVILANAPPADVIILQGIGEPTLHPALPRFVMMAREAGKFGAISFNTNALVRDRAYYQGLRAAGLNHLSVSVNSLEPVTAEATRSGTDCAALELAISDLLALFGPGVTFSIVLSRTNAAELPGLIQRLYDLGGRMVEIQPLVAYGPTSDPLCLDQEELLRVRQSLAAAVPPGLQLMLAAAMTPNGTRCRRPLRAGYVTLDGYLTPCCLTNDVDLFGHANLAEAPFATLWQHPGVTGWMQDYMDREPAICRGCAFNPAGMSPAPVATAEALLRAGKLDEAEAAFRTSLSRSDDATALHGIGIIRLQRGDHGGAEPWLRLAHELAPEARRSHNLAVCLHILGRVQDAIAIERGVAASNAGYVPAQFALADWLAREGETREAIAVLVLLAERAIAADRSKIAADAVDRLLVLPEADAAELCLANQLRCAGWQDLAVRLTEALVRRDPDDLGARLVLAMSHLAVVYASETERTARRLAYTAELERLDQVSATAALPALANVAPLLGETKPFFLAYQGEDDRALQQTYGRIAARISHAAAPDTVRPVAFGAPLRVGFASSYFHLHSVSKLFGGWMRQLDPAGFTVFGYQLGSAVDASSVELEAACASYTRGDLPDAAWRERILADRLHVLIYPEIGMHPLPVRLACHRLAPVQCVAWGHPVTTGLPEIDYFLSSELMEPPDADAHYSERLIRLPNLSIHYEPLPDHPGIMARTALGVDADAIVYLCCQSIFKYLPQHDAVFARIAARVPAARFVFIGTRQTSVDTFQARLAQCFAGFGLDAARHVRIIPPVPSEDFPALLRAADIYLDSIGWSGGNTTLEALACDLPVVTTPTELMRGRHSAAILRHIGLQEHIAPSLDAYVTMATELADRAVRERYRDAVRAARPRLYYDLAPVRALENFLAGAAAAACRTTLPVG